MTFLSTDVIFNCMKHAQWIGFSGLIWAIVGSSLLLRGFALLQAHTPQNTTTMWLLVALLIGYMKGRFVFTKTVTRITKRICELPLPISWKKVYPPIYWIVLGSMGILGFLFRFLPPDIRGCADTAIGSALLYGSLLYLRNAYLVYQQ